MARIAEQIKESLEQAVEMSKQLNVKIKKLSPDAVIPTYSRLGDAAMDLTASSITLRGDKDFIEYGTDIAIQLPKNHVGLLFPRSSLSNYDLTMCNHVGVVDSNYSGEIKLRFRETKENGKHYNIGDRVAQLIIIPYQSIGFVEVDELNETNRGQNGFGSSGA